MDIRQIKTVCNLGTGTMGFGTALFFGLKDYTVNMFGRSEASIKRGRANIRDALQIYVRTGLATQEDVERTLDNIRGCTSYEAAAQGADFVIESVVEDLAVKQEIFAKMEDLLGRDVIFATNTSGLSPTAIAAKMRHPERFVVAHFWNPPQLIPLVEVVPGEKTAPQVVEATAALMEAIGKKPVILKREAPGFIGNRLQFALLREAFYLVEQGIASPEAIDMAVKYSFGRRLCTTGPLESADFGGLDTFLNISSYLNADLSRDTQPSPLLKQAVEQGRLGAKTGKGLYDWTPENLARIKNNRETNLVEWLQKDKMIKF